jgi:site-specific DNA-methyltransferase (adenine-specific)
MLDLRHGDCLEVLRGMEADSVDAVVTDPPYGLSFMGKGWDTFSDICSECGNDNCCDGMICCSDCLPRIGDKAIREPNHGGRSMLGHVSANWKEKGTHSRGYADNDNAAFQRWCEVWAREALRVAKPGAHLLAFGGTRTYHRLACAIEDAGWEVRDCMMWVYGSGFPKGLNLDGQWKGWGTALKPALEPITVARKPLVGTVAANVLRHGTGAINVDGCRVGTVAPATTRGANALGRMNDDGWEPSDSGQRIDPHPAGRWPANLIHDGSDEVVGLFPNTTSGSRKAGRHVVAGGQGRYGEFAEGDLPEVIGDSGSAARFFYCAKASKADRDADNIHPTVKPTALMRYLCRLVTPPNGIVLDPFMGSGSTGKAAILEGFRFVGIEREADYIEIARARIEAASREAGLFGDA